MNSYKYIVLACAVATLLWLNVRSRSTERQSKSQDNAELFREDGYFAAASSNYRNGSDSITDATSRRRKASITRSRALDESAFFDYAEDAFGTVRLSVTPPSVTLLKAWMRKTGHLEKNESSEWVLAILDSEGRATVSPGHWSIVGTSKHGDFSSIADAHILADQVTTVVLDFDRQSSLSGIVFDAVTGDELHGVEVRLDDLAGISLGEPCDDPTGLFSEPRKAITDSTGLFELKVPRLAAATIAVRNPGYRSEYLIQSATDSTTHSLGDIPLFPVDPFDVQLIGLGGSGYSSYRVGVAGNPRTTAVDEFGAARLECSVIDSTSSLAVFRPDGTSFRVDLPSLGSDLTPVVIDVGTAAHVDVTLDAAFVIREDSEVWASVTVSSESEMRYFVNAQCRESGQSVEISVPFSGALAVGLLEFTHDGASWIDLKHVHVEPGGRTHVELGGAERGAFTLLDSLGRPLSRCSLNVRIVGDASNWEASGLTDSEGRFRMPLQHDQELSLSGRTDDGMLILDSRSVLEHREPFGTCIQIGASALYDITLVDGGRALPRRFLTWQSADARSTMRVELTNDAGATELSAIAAGGDPWCKIVDPRLMEYGRQYPLTPGRNTIDVHESATLLLECSGPSVANDITLSSLERPAELQSWLDGGQVQRKVMESGGRTVVRYAPLPLGTYRWARSNGASGEVHVDRAGETTRASL